MTAADFSLPFMGRVAEAQPKPGGGGRAFERRCQDRQALPTRSSLRCDHPPHEGEGEGLKGSLFSSNFLYIEDFGAR